MLNRSLPFFYFVFLKGKKHVKIIEVKNKKEQKKFLDFRRKIYRRSSEYVDNNFFLLKELFDKKTSFIKDKKVYAFYVENKGIVLCQGVVVYSKKLPDYIQLCFFESEKRQQEAVKMLLKKAIQLGKRYGCKRLVVGLYGHVNYGLGLLCSDYGEKNSFSSNANPKYYNDYFEKAGFKKIMLNTYKTEVDYSRIEKYKFLIEKLNRNYTFKQFDKRQFDYFSKIYTDLNNAAFKNHKYYYERKYEEDKEMLKELFLFMNEDSLIFAFDGDKPVGFVMWYPDYNELAVPGEVFGSKHFFKNKVSGKKIRTGKLMEYGILDEYRKSGLVMGLLNQVFLSVKKRNITRIESSWILEENKDSNSVCKELCDGLYRKYVVYEMSLQNRLR